MALNWKKYRLMLAGVEVGTLQNIETDPIQNNSFVYGSGNKPIDISEGNESFTGTITILADEYYKICKDRNVEDMYKLPPCSMVESYEGNLGQIVTITYINVKFEGGKKSMGQGAEKVDISIPFKALDKVTKNL